MGWFTIKGPMPIIQFVLFKLDLSNFLWFEKATLFYQNNKVKVDFTKYRCPLCRANNIVV